MLCVSLAVTDESDVADEQNVKKRTVTLAIAFLFIDILSKLF